MGSPLAACLVYECLRCSVHSINISDLNKCGSTYELNAVLYLNVTGYFKRVLPNIRGLVVILILLETLTAGTHIVIWTHF